MNLATIAVLLTLSGQSDDSETVIRFAPLPRDQPQLQLEVVRHLRRPPAGQSWRGDWPAGLEPSGIVRGRSDDRWFWLLNDSGNEPRLYAVGHDGSDASLQKSGEPGVLIRGASNVDWEDLAVLPGGRLVICDTGNNSNARRDLRLLVAREPSPSQASAPVDAIYDVAFLDQTKFPPPVRDQNFDCEAVYSVGDRLRLITKHRGNALATVYSLPELTTEQVNIAEPIAKVDLGNMVTAADSSDDGLRLLVLTYRSLWLFERDTPGDFFSTGDEVRVSRGDFAAGLVEAVCFADEDSAFIAEETDGTLLRVRLNDLTPVARLED